STLVIALSRPALALTALALVLRLLARLARLRIPLAMAGLTLLALLALLLHHAELGGQLLDLVLLLLHLGAELVVDLLEFARQARWILGPIAVASAGLAERHDALPGKSHHAGRLMLGTEFGQRHRHVDAHVDELVQLLLHLIQFLAALLEVPSHP